MNGSMANGSMKAEAGPGPSTIQHAVKFASPPQLDSVMEITNGDLGPDLNDEAAQLLLNVASTPVESRMVINPISPPRKDVTTSTAYLHTPPDDPIPHHRETSHPPAFASTKPDGRSVSNPLHNAQTPSSDAAASPAPSTTGSSSKPRTKRKRNATAGPSRQPAAITPPVDTGERPDHYLGEDNSLIRCICGFDDDDGFTIQCEKCGAWEHGLCFGYMDEDMAPDKFFCELCVPRPVDRQAARELQDQQRSTVPDQKSGDTPIPGKAGRPRGKKPRADTISTTNPDAKEGSPGAMKPPPPKQKRRPQANNKPRSGKQNTVAAIDPTPTQAVFKEPTIPVVSAPPVSNGRELEYEFYRTKPWAMEYTPLQYNLYRGREAKRAMRKLWLDWADDDREEDFGRKRSLDNPSGLPSPTETGVTRFSPEAILPGPDFSILAPPVPPVTLVGEELEALSASIQIKAIRNTPSFLPLSYTEVASTSGVYSHPSIYGVFAGERIEAGSLIGEMRGEVIDCESYRLDPINQYSGLGMPKPFVRSLGPPVDLMIDCRSYGTDLRFIRSSCHPNAVLRPIVFRTPESDVPRLHFGVFASSNIYRKEEILLGWEWDDYHIVHALESIMNATTLSDGSISAPDILVSGTVRGIAQKFDTVLTTLYGAFSSCACKAPSKCALAQMKYIVDFSDTLEARRAHLNGHRSSAADLGELIGAVRGWRRREMAIHGLNQAEPSAGLRKRDPADLERARAASLAFTDGPREESVERSRRTESVERDVNEHDEEDEEEDKMDLDDEKEDEGERSTNGVGHMEDEETMDVDQDEAPHPLASRQAAVPNGSTRKGPMRRSLSPPNAHVGAESDESPAPQTPTIVATSIPESIKAQVNSGMLTSDPASSLTSLAVSDHKDHAQDDGNESDATTITEARSASSEGMTESEDDWDDAPGLPGQRQQLNARKAHQTSRQSRRSRSATADSGSSMSSDHRPSTAINAEKQDDLKNRGTRALSEMMAEQDEPATEAIKEMDVDVDMDKKSEPEIPREPTPPPKEPTPPPAPKAPTPPPPRRVPLAEYLRSRQSNQGVVPPLETPAAEVKPAGTADPVIPPPPQAPVASPPLAVADDGGIPGSKHYSPPKEPNVDLPATTPSSAQQPALPSPVTSKPDVDASTKAFNIKDYLPTHNGTQSSTIKTPMVESPMSAAATPGLGLHTRDYFPTQPIPPVHSTPGAPSQVSSSYVPRKSSSYVPRASSSSTPAESPVAGNDHLTPSQGSGSISSSYVPRPSPRSEAPPLPPTPTPSSFQPRYSPYRSQPPLPEMKEERYVGIPPPATRELPPHARPPPTGPKVPPTGPRTSGGSVGSTSFPSRDRDWESRDRERDWERERDRDRDWETRDRDRDRDRDREPVSPRAVFSVGSARGGAPIPVPFHRGRGGGRGGGFRGGGPGRNW